MEKSLSFSIEEERKELFILAQKLTFTNNNNNIYDGKKEGIKKKHEINWFLEFSSSTKDSSLKKVTSLIRRLKSIPTEPLPQLLKDIQQINLSMHFGEVCTSVLENRPKNSAEYLCIVKVILNLMIETDPELKQMFYRELIKNITGLVQNGVVPTDKNSFNSFRFYFRLACELQAATATENKFNGLSSVLQKLVTSRKFIF